MEKIIKEKLEYERKQAEKNLLKWALIGKKSMKKIV